MIVCDRREPKFLPVLRHACETASIPFEVAEHQYGDIHLYPPRGTEKVVGIERKEYRDLIHSMVTGRVQEQLHNLPSVCDIPYLLVEGLPVPKLVDGKYVIPAGKHGFNYYAVQMYLAAVQDAGIRVAHTPSVAHTALWVVKNYQRLCKGENGTVADFPRPKDRTLRPDVAALCAAPGVGPKVAQALIARFGSVVGVGMATDGRILDTPGVGPVALRSLRSTLGKPPAPVV